MQHNASTDFIGNSLQRRSLFNTRCCLQKTLLTPHTIWISGACGGKNERKPDANSQLKAGTKILIRIRTEYNHRNDERMGKFIWRWTLITNGQERLRQPARLPNDGDVTKITDCTISAISECVLAAVCFLTRVYTSSPPSEYLLNRTQWLAWHWSTRQSQCSVEQLLQMTSLTKGLPQPMTSRGLTWANRESVAFEWSCGNPLFQSYHLRHKGIYRLGKCVFYQTRSGEHNYT